MKKTTIITLAFILIGVLANAQKNFKKSLSGVKRIEIETATNVRIVKGSSNEIIISEGCSNCGDNNDEDHFSGDETNEQKENEKAKGLKAIYANGEDNVGLGMFMQQDGEVLKLKDLKVHWKRSGLTITLPSSIALRIDGNVLGSVYVDKWVSELEIKTNVGSIYLKDVTGPVTAHSTTGNIEVVFSNVNQNSPISISSTTGAIDVSLPANTKASVELKSTMGSVYSNFDLVKPREDGLKPISGEKNIAGNLNNGGVKISLKASTGNIYLRKK